MVNKEMCIADVAGFDTFSSARAMVLRSKSYGFEEQELWFRGARAMVLRSKSYGFEEQELWF